MYKFNEKFKVSRFRNHYKEFYPCELDSKCKSFVKTINVDVKKPTLIVNGNDWMKQTFLYMFMKLGCVDFKLYSAYSLLDIYLGNNEDVKSILDLTADVICLYLGYGEFENKRQVDVIIQLINNMVLQGKTVWIYCRQYSLDKCDVKYPGLSNFFEQSGYNIVSSKRGPVGKVDEI